MGAYDIYSPIDSEAQENRSAINIGFVTQYTPHIRKKLQKLEGCEEKNLSKLVKIVTKVCNNWEDQEDKQARKTARGMLASLNDDTS